MTSLGIRKVLHATYDEARARLSSSEISPVPVKDLAGPFPRSANACILR